MTSTRPMPPLAGLLKLASDLYADDIDRARQAAVGAIGEDLVNGISKLVTDLLPADIKPSADKPAEKTGSGDAAGEGESVWSRATDDVRAPAASSASAGTPAPARYLAGSLSAAQVGQTVSVEVAGMVRTGDLLGVLHTAESATHPAQTVLTITDPQRGIVKLPLDQDAVVTVPTS